MLVVATGQAALTANATLQKLIDRFSVTVALSDTDVETVVRKVVLRKKPDAIAEIEAVIRQAGSDAATILTVLSESEADIEQEELEQLRVELDTDIELAA